MNILEANTFVATTPNELTSALSNDNGYDYIYLGADITMTAGVYIHSSKTALVIDGEYPEGSGIIHELTDAGGDGGMIRISSPIDVTFQNLTIRGRNYHGMPRVADGAAGEGTTVTYISVTYIGPQLTFHRYGRTRIFDCNITIQDSPGYSGADEIAECRWVEIGGKTTIEHGSTDNAAFWFYNAGSSLTILEDAEVTISAVYDFLYRSNDYPAIVIAPRARFALTTRFGISRDSGHHVSSVLVDEEATFRYIRTSTSGSDAALYIRGTFTVNGGANVYMEANFANNGQLMRFTSDLSSTERGLFLNKPRSFVLYNSGTGVNAAAFYFAGATPFLITTGQINHWPDAVPLGEERRAVANFAPGRWHKPNWEEFFVRGSARTTAPAGTTIEDTNLVESDIDPASPLSMLQLQTARVFSAGEYPLVVKPIVAGGKHIKGTTDNEASVEVDYMGTSRECIILTDADDNGEFSASTENEEPVQVGTLVTVASAIPFLLVTATALAIEDGTLEIVAAPIFLPLVARPFSTSPDVLLPREVPEAPVIVSDTRVEQGPWLLWARVNGPLETGEGDVLSNSVVFAPEEGNLITLNGTFIQVYSDIGPPYEEYPDFPELSGRIIVWEPEKGVLGRITDPIRPNIGYSTILDWYVTPEGEVPEEEVPEEEVI